MEKSFSHRASRVADIILQSKGAGKKVKAKQISLEIFSMLKEVRLRLIRKITKRGLIGEAAYGAGRLLNITKRVYRNISKRSNEGL